MQRLGWLVLCLSLVTSFAGTRPAAPAWAQADAAASGSIAGFVFLDSDGDGVLGPSEPGLTVVPVQLKGPVDRTVLSSMNGAYSFTDLPPGSYDISVEPGPEWSAQSQGMYAGLVVNGDALENVNFALEAARPPADVAPAPEATGPSAAAPGDEVDALAAGIQMLGALGLADGSAVDPATLDALRRSLDEAQAEGGTLTLGDLLARGLAAVSTAPVGMEDGLDSGAPLAPADDSEPAAGGLTSSAFGTSSYETAPEAEGPAGGEVSSDGAAAGQEEWDVPSDAIQPELARRHSLPGGTARTGASARPHLPHSGLGAPSGLGFGLALGLILGVVAVAGAVLERT